MPVKYPNVSKWLQMSQDEVLDKFHSLEGAYSDGTGDKRFVYIAGTRKNKALLVAHADTVWTGAPINLHWYNGVLYSKNRDVRFEQKSKWSNGTITKYGIGIGADDRAGCAILWCLRELGHSLLITSGEEDGCISSKWLIKEKWWEDEITNEHQFAIEFDRRGHNDLVFYDVGTNAFAKYAKAQTGFVPKQGFGTDIKYLCKGICGVNLSVGYYSEHTTEEKLVYDQWLNTLGIAKNWLSQDNLPKFILDKKDSFSVPTTSYYNNHNSNSYHHNYHYSNTNSNKSTQSTTISTSNLPTLANTKPTNTDKSSVFDSVHIVDCRHCKKSVSRREWYLNLLRCTHCKRIM
jgi:hypothetical protein